MKPYRTAWGVSYNLLRTRFHLHRTVITETDGLKLQLPERYTSAAGRRVTFRSMEAAQKRADELNAADGWYRNQRGFLVQRGNPAFPG